MKYQHNCKKDDLSSIKHYFTAAMKRILSCDWLPVWARWGHLVCSGLLALIVRKEKEIAWSGLQSSKLLHNRRRWRRKKRQKTLKTNPLTPKIRQSVISSYSINTMSARKQPGYWSSVSEIVSCAKKREVWVEWRPNLLLSFFNTPFTVALRFSN